MSWFRTFDLPRPHWLDEPSIVKGGGPERVATEAAPDDWKPQPLVGFTSPAPEPVEPLLWEGDRS